MVFRGFSKDVSTADAILFRQKTCKTGNNAVEMSQAYHDIAHLECFKDLNVFKYVFTVIQNWETDALRYFHFLLAVMVEGDESSRRFWLATGPY